MSYSALNAVDSVLKILTEFHINFGQKQVRTQFGIGEITESNNTHSLIRFDHMLAYVKNSNCTQLCKNSVDNDIQLRIIEKTDLKTVIELEKLAFSADEAANPEKIYFRYIFAHQYFQVFCLNGIVIGFICGTKAKGVLTHESLSAHISDGKHLCIHSVVIQEKYQRKGYATQMMKLYVHSLHSQLQSKELLSIRLLCKQYLIKFYSSVGFQFIGESNVIIGKDAWYEMVIE